MQLRPYELRAEEVAKRLPEGGKYVEVGVLDGKMAGAVIQRRPDVEVVMIDNWKARDDQPEEYKQTRDRNAHMDPKKAEIVEARARAVARPQDTILKGNSVDMAEQLEDESCDLIFIDADHSYKGCFNDIMAFYPKVKPGGYIGGHDYKNKDPRFKFEGVDQAVSDALLLTYNLKGIWAKIEEGANFTWFIKL